MKQLIQASRIPVALTVGFIYEVPTNLQSTTRDLLLYLSSFERKVGWKMKDTHWEDKRVIVTGAASFIGSHLVDRLVGLGAKVTAIDNFSSDTLENLSQSQQKINIIKMNLEWCNLTEIADAFKDHEIVFHLAATHGGRGYINTHAPKGYVDEKLLMERLTV